MIDTDVCILGAGMAGLTLAKQLRQRCPELDLTVVEHRRFPVAQASHKVGESTVEIASHYLSTELGLTEHLQNMQLPKFGLRLFLRGQEPIHDDLARYDEIGPSRVLPIPTYQLDRGRFENHLAQDCLASGVRLLDATTVRSVDLQAGAHQVKLRNEAQEISYRARFLVDASGRRAWLRRAASLSRPARHGNHAIWFRIEGELDVDAWGTGSAWQQRCHTTERRLSTNHFTGPGYWLWLIPLASNATSVGLVFDPKYVDLAQVRTHAALLAWLQREHPLVAAALQDRPLLDFHLMENYAVTSAQVFSAQGWMTSGDAGIFSDPLYSPGGDFIALANGYITELIAQDVRDPKVVADYQGYFFSFFASTLSLYRGQYGGFGNRDFWVAKTLWDYAFYWSVLSKLYFSGKYKDLAFMRDSQPLLLEVAALNTGMQKRFREIAARAQRVGGEGRFYDHHAVPLFHELKQDLLDGEPAMTAARLDRSATQLQGISERLQKLLEGHRRGVASPPLDQALGL